MDPSISVRDCVMTMEYHFLILELLGDSAEKDMLEMTSEFIL